MQSWGIAVKFAWPMEYPDMKPTEELVKLVMVGGKTKQQERKIINKFL